MSRRLAIGTATLLTFALGAMLAVLVAGSASAASTTKKKTTPAKTTPAKATAATPTVTGDTTTTTETPADSFFVINGTATAASDHEIVGSSAFPNYANGAVDNYYSLARTHVDNSPFAEGLSSPFDTGPVGQTAAAGNTQQPQYADARWPGTPGKAEYGSQGGPHAVASASSYDATADASEATNALTGPAATNGIAIPGGLNGRLRQALAGWKATWLPRLTPKKPVAPSRPTVPLPKVPAPKIPVPKTGVTTPVATVTAPALNAPAPLQAPPTVPAPTVPSPTAAPPSRSLAAQSTPNDGESALTSSTHVTLVPGTATPNETTTTQTTTTSSTDKKKKNTTGEKKPKPYTLVTSGESSLGRVSLGGGQIVIEGIHVTASIRNDGNGSPSYAAKVSIASATIGGVPVTIDADGVHVAGQGQALPYQQASDALNNALKQAGIQLFLVAPEVNTNTCGQSGGGGGGSTGTTTTTTTTTSTPTSTDQSGASDACGQSSSSSTCDQASSGGGGGIGVPTSTTTGTSTTSTTPSSCDQSTTCDQASANSGGGSNTTTTTTTSSTTGSSGCTGTSGTTGGSCKPGGASGTTTTTSGQPDATSSSGSGDLFGLGAGGASAGEETVRATGVHVVFTQPVNQAGVPSQQIEHILGDVFVDSLAVPGGTGSLPGFDFSGGGAGSGAASCLGGFHSGGKATSGGGIAGGGGSSLGGAASSSSSLPSSASGFASGSQPVGGSSSGSSLPVAMATALRKPVWLLLGYLVWQLLVIGTGVSLWNWRKGDAS